MEFVFEHTGSEPSYLPDSFAVEPNVRFASDYPNYKRDPRRRQMESAEAMKKVIARTAFARKPTEVSRKDPGLKAYPRVTEETEQEFFRLRDEWISETKYMSDPVATVLHWAHLKIIGMGPVVVPFLLRELEQNSADWFMALNSTSDQNPVSEVDQEDYDLAREKWLEWGRANSLL